MDNMELYKRVCEAFLGEEKITDISQYGQGHINTTMLVCTRGKRYILQKINTSVFPSPEDVMNNIYGVTNHLKNKGKETLNVITTVDGKLYLNHDTGCFRMYDFVDNSVSHQSCADIETLYYAGKAFGEFQNDLADFDPKKLKEIIPDFHNTPKRYEKFKKAVSEDKYDRLKTCCNEVEFVTKRNNTYSDIVNALNNREIPVRITHNDTKLNNILMDGDTNKPRAIIDLDTVMPGSMLYDYGDAIRFGTSTGKEDEKQLELIHFNIDAFRAYTCGYLGSLKNNITKKELELMPYSAYLMTMECGMRFLTDYLEGDTYFMTHYPEHNLVRCRTQFKLASEMEKQFDKMHCICNEAIK